jgi:CBS-domain-containing membrane protein
MVQPGAGPAVLLAAFADWRIGALPVVDAERRLIGVVSYVDVLNHFAEIATRTAVTTPR